MRNRDCINCIIGMLILGMAVMTEGCTLRATPSVGPAGSIAFVGSPTATPVPFLTYDSWDQTFLMRVPQDWYVIPHQGVNGVDGATIAPCRGSCPITSYLDLIYDTVANPAKTPQQNFNDYFSLYAAFASTDPPIYQSTITQVTLGVNSWMIEQATIRNKLSVYNLTGYAAMHDGRELILILLNTPPLAADVAMLYQTMLTSLTFLK